jgi:mannosyltransferase
MSNTSTTPESAPSEPKIEPITGLPARHNGAKIALVAGVVAIVIAVVLRFASKSDMWLDEALTVNIAKAPLGSIGTYLKHDGAPPLYYWLLHAWISVFGDGDRSVRALSGLFGVAMLPASWFVGRRVGGRSVAWITVLLVAVSPFAVRYSDEARMYSLVTLIALFGYLAIARLFEKQTVWRAAPVAIVVAAGLYTQYWLIYLGIAAGIGMLAVAWKGNKRERRAAMWTLGAFVVGGLAFIPWLPTFLYQSKHTGTPWAVPSVPSAGFADTIIGFGGGNHAEAAVIALILVVLVFLALFGRSTDEWHIELDLRTRPGSRLVFGLFVGGLGVGLLISLVTGGAYQVRYGAPVFAFFIVGCACGVMVLTQPIARIVLLTILVGACLIGSVRVAREERTQAGAVAAVVKAEYKPGDVVVYCPDQLGPAVSRLLPKSIPGLTYPAATRPEFVDWVDYKQRNAKATPAAFMPALQHVLGPQGRVWYVWYGGYRTYTGQCEALYNALAAVRPVIDANRITPNPDIFEVEQLSEFSPTPVVPAATDTTSTASTTTTTVP